MRAVQFQPIRDVLMHQRDVVQTVEAPGDACLVAQHRDRNPGPVESRDRLRGAVDEFNAFDRTHVAVIDNDRAIAIEKDTGSRGRARLPRRRRSFACGLRASIRPVRTLRGADDDVGMTGRCCRRHCLTSPR